MVVTFAEASALVTCLCLNMNVTNNSAEARDFE